MDDPEKKRCLAWVRTVITDRLRGESSRYEGAEPGDSSGVFVTLRQQGDLRGCIGLLRSEGKVLSSVLKEAALSAAFGDPRFSPLTISELEQIEIEISLLSPFRMITNPREIILGTHGVLMYQGYRSALFLPQVATEQGWDRETFLSQLSRKAGLPADAWQGPEIRFQVFTAEVFSERDFFE